MSTNQPIEYGNEWLSPGENRDTHKAETLDSMPKGNQWTHYPLKAQSN
jgi:hypothetical protein